MSCGDGCRCSDCRRDIERDPGLHALAWGLQAARLKPGQPAFWSVAEAVHFYDYSAAQGVHSHPMMRTLVRGVALTNTLRAHTPRSLDTDSVAHVLASYESSPQGIAGALQDLLGYLASQQLTTLLASLRTHLGPSHAALLTIFILDPRLLLLLIGIAAFIAFLLWLISLLVAIAVPWLKRRRRACCPESISFDTSMDLEDPCRPHAVMTVNAAWLPAPPPCHCDCCEVRQFVTTEATITKSDGVAVPHIGMLDIPQPPYSAVPSSIDDMVRTDDPWTLHDIGGTRYMEDQRFKQAMEDGEFKSGLALLSVDAFMELQRPGAKERMGRRMVRFGVNEGKGSECKYTYTDHPAPPACTEPGMKVKGTFKFVVVIRPKPGCDGEPMIKQCSISLGCWWSGAPPWDVRGYSSVGSGNAQGTPGQAGSDPVHCLGELWCNVSRWLIIAVTCVSCVGSHRGDPRASVELREECETLHNRVASLLEILQRYETLYGPIQDTHDGVVGQVVAVNGMRVAIPVGARDGIEPGDIFFLKRRSIYVGRVRVLTVEENSCVAELVDAVPSNAAPCLCDDVYR